MALIEEDLDELRNWRPADAFADAIRGPAPAPAPAPTRAMAPLNRKPISNPLANIDQFRGYIDARRPPASAEVRPADEFSDAISGPTPVDRSNAAPQLQLPPAQREAISAIDPVTQSRVQSQRTQDKREEGFGWRGPSAYSPPAYSPPSIDKEEPGWDWKTHSMRYGEGPLTEQEMFARRTMKKYGVQPDVAKRTMEETRFYGGNDGPDDPGIIQGAAGWYYPDTAAVWMDNPDSRVALHEFGHHARDPSRAFFPEWKRQQLSLALDDEIRRKGPFAEEIEAARPEVGDEHLYQYLIGDIKGDLSMIESPYLEDLMGDFYTGARDPGLAWPEAIYSNPYEWSGNYQQFSAMDPEYFSTPDREIDAVVMSDWNPALSGIDHAQRKSSEIVNEILGARARGAIDNWARENPGIWDKLPRQVKEKLTNDPTLLGPDENGNWG